MGDADNQIRMAVGELEARLGDVLDDVDDGLGDLLNFMSVINERTAFVLSEISAWQKLRHCFTALNLFIIPVIVAIGLTYALGGSEESNPNIVSGVQMLISFLMYLSGCIGLPVYIFALVDTYFLERSKVARARTSLFSGILAACQNNGDNEARDTSQMIGDPLPLRTGEDSLDRYTSSERTVNRKLLEYVRQDMEQRAGQMDELGQVKEWLTETSKLQMAQNVDDQGFVSVKKNQVQLSFEELSDTEIPATETINIGNECLRVPVIILETASDLSGNIKKKDKCEETKDCKKRSGRQSSVPHIESRLHNYNSAVKKVVEGSVNYAFSPEIEHAADKVNCRK